jgi:hypothetical protein
MLVCCPPVIAAKRRPRQIEGRTSAAREKTRVRFEGGEKPFPDLGDIVPETGASPH